MNPFDKFKFDHIAVRMLFMQFKRAMEAGDTHRMRRCKQAIIHELKVQKASEEEVLHPPVQELEGEVKDLVEKSKQEHRAIEELIAQVQGLDVSDAEFVAKMTELIHRVDHHVAGEEQELLPKLGEALGEERLDRVASQLEQTQRRQSTRWPAHE